MQRSQYARSAYSISIRTNHTRSHRNAQLNERACETPRSAETTVHCDVRAAVYAGMLPDGEAWMDMCMLHVAGCMRRVAHYMLHAACCMVRMLHVARR